MPDCRLYAYSSSFLYIPDRGALLTPGEMEELTGTWKPYRSLGPSNLT